MQQINLLINHVLSNSVSFQVIFPNSISEIITDYHDIFSKFNAFNIFSINLSDIFTY